ncbi:rubredoxin [Hydrogenophaga sp.]|jgi:rubredoxin|uniref:rubredoxin n=1 Tax=Hydrogenophaga sp. TaxID=1904254 RepID=UPI003F71962F
MSEPLAQVQDAQWMCLPCGHVYDPAHGAPEQGIPPGTRFEALGPDYACPVCGVGTDEFEAI